MSPDRKRVVIELVRRAPGAKRQALAELGLAASTYYRWQQRWRQHGTMGLQDQRPQPGTVWNRLAKEERRYFEAAMLEVLSKPGARDPEYVLTAVAEAVTGVKAADRAKQHAASIGTAMHAGIEWALRTQLGEDAGPEPGLPDAAAWGLESWKDWAKSVGLEPLAIERTVYCEVCGYAGTLDLYARVRGVLTVLDWKSGKAIYPEAFLQNIAYRHAATRRGMPSTQGLIVRLPKYQDDPAWEAMPVPDALTIEDFRAALRLWRWQRRMAGQSEGDRPPSRSGIHPTETVGAPRAPRIG